MADEATPTQFESWSVTLDPSATTAAYQPVKALDASCCNACATWLRALVTHQIPPSVVQFIEAAGIDPRKPYTLYGAPEDGSLFGFFLFRAQMLSPQWDGSSEAAMAEPQPGFRCWLARSTVVPPPSFKGLGLVQLEFQWESPQVAAIERVAWVRP
jgi:hypothetical protein